MTPPSRQGGHAAPDPMHLVWFHHAGGHGESFRAMAAHLPSHWRVSLVEYPGRGALAHLPAYGDLAELAAWLLPDIAPLAQQPFAFFGHSMGALVAHELARQMQARRLPPPLWIGVSGHRAPQLAKPPAEQLHALSDEALVDRLKHMGALPAHAVTPAYIDLMRTDLRACETHHTVFAKATGVLPCSLSTFTGNADPMVRAQDMHPWSDHVSKPVRHHVLPGGHFFLAGVRRRQVLELIVHDIEAARRAEAHHLHPIDIPTNPPFIDHAKHPSSSHDARLGLRHLEDVDRR